MPGVKVRHHDATALSPLQRAAARGSRIGCLARLMVAMKLYVPVPKRSITTADSVSSVLGSVASTCQGQLSLTMRLKGPKLGCVSSVSMDGAKGVASG